jgi:hypothetical protein
MGIPTEAPALIVVVLPKPEVKDAVPPAVLITYVPFVPIADEKESIP